MGPGDLEVWSNHFEYHAQRPGEVAQGVADSLRHEEWQLIAGSLATAQLGGPAVGPELLLAAERVGGTKRIPPLARIIELLIHEELRHASLLSAFMRNHWMPMKRCGLTYRLFGYVRGLAGLHGQLSMLIASELIGIVYYRALESVTACAYLRLLCRIIVADKLAHVGFESELLAALRIGQPAPWRAFVRSAHRMVFTVTALVVWSSHRPVLRRAEYGARSFLRACLAQYEFYLESTQARATAIAS